MNFYKHQHEFYAGIDLHAKNFYACLIDNQGKKILHRNFKNQKPEQFFDQLAPYRHNIVIGCESTFNWYWLADLCCELQIPFVLGHAQYMKAIHGGKAKNDKIDSEKLAFLLRGGNFPLSYVYPKQRRATRDLMRRRSHYVRRRAEAMAHIRMVNNQYNLSDLEGSLDIKSNRQRLRDELKQRFEDPSAQMSVLIDLNTIDDLSTHIRQLENYLKRHTKVENPEDYFRCRSIPGIGSTLAMIMLYEIGDIGRFKTVGKFLSYARLVRGKHTSAGKNYGSSGHKIGNPHLKWAFSEAAALCKRCCVQARAFATAIEKRHSKARSFTLLSNKLGRAIYYMLKKQVAFDPKIFELK